MTLPPDILDPHLALPEPLPAEPMSLLAAWLDEAVRTRSVPNPNAMVLATVAAADPSEHHSPRPSARVVLCKHLEPSAGAVVFFTNYGSRKGLELRTNPHAAAVFHFDYADRQARLEGLVEPTTEAESDEYFNSRPLLSRLGAWSSEQSRPLARRADLLNRLETTLTRFGLNWSTVKSGAPQIAIPRPPFWGGFRLHALSVELWQGVPGRLHDRAVWTRTHAAAPWSSTRLQP